MLNRWQVLRSSPDEYSHPDQLSQLWRDSIEIAAPATVATAGHANDYDDFDWWLKAVADTNEATHVEFKGLTFPATVFVDGDKVAECQSMFLPVCAEMGPGHHEVCVRFHSLNQWLKTRRPRGRWRSNLVSAAGLRWARTTLIGRAPVYGNLPAPVGFWRPIVATPARFVTRLTVTADAETGTIDIKGTTASSDDVVFTVTGPTGTPIAEGQCLTYDGTLSATARVSDPQLWWPHGYGPQNLYRVTVRIGAQVVTQRLLGFRSVHAVTDDGGFRIHINDQEVFCRGVAWTPPDPVRLTVDESTLREHLTRFAEAGANMVRVVGGLVYEQDGFWQICAELGLMVWQDAMLANFDPPEEVAELVVREMEALLDSVGSNPALTVVSGGSETLQRPEMLGIGRDGFTMDLVDSVLPQIVAQRSGVPYVRASPSPSAGADDLAIRPDTGVAHWFGVGAYLRPLGDVRAARVRFAAECLAFANPPTAVAVERYFGSPAVAGHHPDWKAEVPRERGASWDFEDVRDFYVREVFGEDPLAVRRVDPERYLQLGRLAIAEAMRECFAFWRQSDSGCSGALVLAGKDLRPGSGWGLMDVDGEPKAALKVLQRIWAPVAVIVTDAGLSGIRIDLYNDTDVAMRGELSLCAVNSSGQRAVEAWRTVTLPARSSVTYADSDVSGTFRDLSNSYRFGQPTADGVEVIIRFTEPALTVRDALIVNPRPAQVDAGILAVASPRKDGEWELEISSKVALRYVSVDVPGWTSSDNFFHLLAGSPYTVRLWQTVGGSTPTGFVTSIDSLVAATITAAP